MRETLLPAFDSYLHMPFLLRFSRGDWCRWCCTRGPARGFWRKTPPNLEKSKCVGGFSILAADCRYASVYLRAISCTGWFQHENPNSFRVQLTRRSWERPRICTHACSICPCRAFYECFVFVFLFPLQIFGYCIWRDTGVSRDISSKTHTLEICSAWAH